MLENGYRWLEYDDANMGDMEFVEFIKTKELHYDLDKKLWVTKDEYTGDWYPAVCLCRSVRAAKRHIRKHNEIPKGTIFRLVSQYIGVPDVILRKR